MLKKYTFAFILTCLASLCLASCVSQNAMPSNDRSILQKTPGKDFVILNLSDPQMGNDEWIAGHNTRKVLVRTLEELIARVRPDLITISGDLSWAPQSLAYESLASYLDSFRIPWANVWGNHDNQEGYDFVHSVAQGFAKHQYSLFQEGPRELGNGNYVLKIMENGKPITAIFMMDTHDREQNPNSTDPKELVWGRMFPNQFEWYEKQCASLKSQGFQDSMLVVHIPVYAYQDAFKAAYASSDDPHKVSYEQSLDKAMWNEGYKDSFGVRHEGICSYPLEDNAFASILRADFTKMIVAGHDHVNNFVIPYKGVKMVYSLKTGCACYWEPGLNGGTVITIGDQGIKDVRHEFVSIPEELWPKKEK